MTDQQNAWQERHEAAMALAQKMLDDEGVDDPLAFAVATTLVGAIGPECFAEPECPNCGEALVEADTPFCSCCGAERPLGREPQ